MTQALASYIARRGYTGDTEAVYNLVFAIPDENIRQRTYEDVEAMLDAGELYVLQTETGTVVGTAYITTATDTDPAEYGGAFVHQSHRRRGLMQVLGDLALADYRTTHYDQPDEIIAHVVVGNDKPRGVLASLGFELKDEDRDQQYPPDAIPGLGHMPTQEDGMIHADTYRLNPRRLIHRMRGVLDLPPYWTAADHEHVVSVTIALRSYTSGAMREVYDELLLSEGEA